MKVLVVGGGGREHALCWKIRQSPLVDEVYCAPGNAGTAEVATNVDLSVSDTAGLIAFAKAEQIGLTVIGPEDPLCDGIVDAFRGEDLKAFGPSKAGANIEGSKAFARDFCKRNRIPSPSYWVYDNPAHAKAFLENRPDSAIVVKASGLAAGKGVIIAQDRDEAHSALRTCSNPELFGDAGHQIVFEEFLEGTELSVMMLTDGHTIIPFEPARDHKPVLDGNNGPNTGGMGAVSPVASLGNRIRHQIENQVLIPAVHGMNREEIEYRGFLYAGLMLTASGPRVLEFNCRLGDPETQPLLMRLKSDIVPLMLHTIDGTLDQLEAPEWDTRTAVCVVACSGGYPGEYDKGMPIHGLETIESAPDLQVFHAGTTIGSGELSTSGGRVLAVCALGDGVEEARRKAYENMAKIEFRGKHCRSDIPMR
ncbi:MAG: phosphoribosylamine--glycine ligase [Planctomycetota bacterium]|nr:phosphoribosylamine--glycine ligase [Planctomycetota bacterium]